MIQEVVLVALTSTEEVTYIIDYKVNEQAVEIIAHTFIWERSGAGLQPRQAGWE